MTDPVPSQGGGARGGRTVPVRSAARVGIAVVAVAGLAWWGSVGGGWGPLSAREQAPGSDQSAVTDVRRSDGERGAEGDGERAAASEDATLVSSAALACPGLPDGRSSAIALRAAAAPRQLFTAMQATGAAGQQDDDEQDDGQGVPDQEGAAAQPDEVGSVTVSRIAADVTADPAGGRGGTVLAVGTTHAQDLASGQAAAVVADGPAAPGLTAAQWTVGTSADGRGASLAACGESRETQWLFAGGGAAGRVEQVVLTNPGADPVQVDLAVYDADGEVALTGGAGIVVPAGSQVIERLDALAPGADAPAVLVASRGGPVVAHLTDRYREGTTDLGVDVTGAAAGPARDLVIPALPPAATDGGTRTLRVVAPEGEALVELRALTESGAQTPGTPALRVPAGSTVDLPLDDLPEGVVGLRLRSDQPISAALAAALPPTGDEPIVVDEAATTSRSAGGSSDGEGGDGEGGDGESSDGTGVGDASEATASPTAEGESSSEASADSPSTSADTERTADPTDDAPSGTGGSDEPVIHPAGDLTWLPAVEIRAAPVGLALPVPGAGEQEPGAPEFTLGVPAVRLAITLTSLDATTVQVLWLRPDGVTQVDDVELGNDTSVLVEVPDGAEAVWIGPADPAGPGLAAALTLVGSDDVGPYLAATSLPTVPWTRDVTAIRRVVP